MQYDVKYTDEQQAVRLMDVEQVKDLLARRAYYLDADDRAGELEALWVREAENRLSASYGENWGYFTGMDSLKAHYGALRASRDTGFGAVHTVNTGHVILAWDGKTARGLFYDVYERCELQPDGSVQTIVVCGPVACDFMKEADGWKIWHLFQGADHVFTVGQDYAEVPIPRPQESNPAAQNFFAFGTPDVLLNTYDPDYGWADNYPALPEPYMTFDPLSGYGPEGHPNYVKEVLFS